MHVSKYSIDGVKSFLGITKQATPPPPPTTTTEKSKPFIRVCLDLNHLAKQPAKV